MKMSKSNLMRFVALLLAMVMALGMAACGQQEPAPADGGETTAPTAETQPEETQPEEEVKPEASGEEQKPTVPETTEEKTEAESEKKPSQQKPETPSEEDPPVEQPEEKPIVPAADTYNAGVVLVKCKTAPDAAAYAQYGVESAEPLYAGSSWYSLKLSDTTDTTVAVAQLRRTGAFEKVDYDYVMSTGAKENENPKYDQQVNLGLSNIPHGWTVNGKAPGGDPSVIIAVIDTGVDYNHLDLRNNIWVNSAEIPDNGIDDDGNGYIDDVYGWDCVGNDNDPMDDNGHGTHVAGIIAAENNKEGGIGVAYNCKVMVLKAGNSSGYFNNSDIAEAVQYAYMNGASVINMSFGGSNISFAVEDALESAYNSCVLVAAAGNDGACNDLSCKECDVRKVCYPAALPYVIGVMSVNHDGKHISSFSNYDHNPYDTIEYEVYAVGEGVGSTWPSNKYACLNGTSMAAPTVAGIAALVRSYYSDREMYSTKFIQSQIVNTGTVYPHNELRDHETDEAHSVADVKEALTKLPKPAVNLYDYKIDDSVSISEKNNGNGVIDAGETVRLYFSLHNRGGVASNVQVSIDTYRSQIGDEAMTDPYFTFVNNNLSLSDIGTYSVRESGEQYFEIIVDGNCPNDYLVNFNIRFTYRNGLDEKDEAAYAGAGAAKFNVSSGYHLPSVIAEDTVFPADRLYIVGENVLIASGVTVTFEPGAKIQFYADQDYYSSPLIQVYGTLNLQGTAEEMISVNASERYMNFACIVKNYGNLNVDYVDGTNLYISNQSGNAVTNNSLFRTDGSGKNTSVYWYNGGKAVGVYDGLGSDFGEVYNSYIEVYAYGYNPSFQVLEGNFLSIRSGNRNWLSSGKTVNNIIYTGNVCDYDAEVSTFYGVVENNFFMTEEGASINTLLPIKFANKDQLKNNRFSESYRKNASQVITGYLDAYGEPTIDVFADCSNISALYPHVVSVELFNADGEQITTIGKEEIKVRITFNRPMAQNVNPTVTFGTIEPFADYKIEGQWVDELVWEGTYTLKAQIENGQNFLKVKNACDAYDLTKVVQGDYQKYEFTIDTTAAMAMSLFATATDSGIELTWAQDDYATLMGYNIYRSTAKDGNFVKINPSVLTANESSFVDTNAEPGVTYWYTFTVVLSDFSESAPAGKVYCTAVDTILPTVYHTPVNQGYLNNNLVISCTASDNMKVANVTLYYRTAGTESWKSLSMLKVNDKYSATIFGSELTLDGIEYYLVAADTSNSVSKGTAEEPYFVVIKDASVISRKGDVDGNGVVNTKDALMIIQCINGDLIMTDDEFKRADLNGDNLLSSVEALRILQYINGNVPDLNM